MCRSFEGQGRARIVFFDKPFSVRHDRFEQKAASGVHVALGIGPLEGLCKWRVRVRAAGVRCAGPVDHGFPKLACFSDPGRYQVRLACCTLDGARSVDHKQTPAGRIERERANNRRQREAERFGAGASDRLRAAEFHNR